MQTMCAKDTERVREIADDSEWARSNV